MRTVLTCFVGPFRGSCVHFGLGRLLTSPTLLVLLPFVDCNFFSFSILALASRRKSAPHAPARSASVGHGTGFGIRPCANSAIRSTLTFIASSNVLPSPRASTTSSIYTSSDGRNNQVQQLLVVYQDLQNTFSFWHRVRISVVSSQNIGLCLSLFLVGFEIDAEVVKKNARLSTKV